jgi:thermostable 8-oxoguanine DNA glycosylase
MPGLELPRIIPKEITNIDRTQEEKEQFLIFCVLCAGKSSEVMAKKLEDFLCYETHPFGYITTLLKDGQLRTMLTHVKLGKYDMLEACFGYITRFQYDLVTLWPRDQLVKIPGVSWKTASLYRMHCYDDRIACLDTHVLKFLRNEGYKKVPNGSPSAWTTYRHWEAVFLGECYKRDVKPSHFDLELWKEATS